MSFENSDFICKKRVANYRLCNISGHKTDLLEIQAEDPKSHILFIPGNPGVITFYADFVENLFEQLEGTASITALGHISQTEKDWEQGKLFTLEDQINHKIDFMNNALQDIKVPLILIGHSVGSYMSLEITRRCPEKVVYYIGLYPFFSVDEASSTQSFIKWVSMSRVLSTAFASLAAFVGTLPKTASRFLVKKSVGKSWSSTAVEALITYLLKYHTIRNVLFLTMTEFEKLSEAPDWEFMREKRSQIAFLFGDDDSWAPLHLHDEISRNVPGVALAIEHEGYTHNFSCTKAGSLWVSQHVANLIKNCKPSEVPDWEFMREKRSQIAFLFGDDDSWAPLHLHDEISRNVPGVALAIEHEGYTHNFSCTKAGSLWVSQHVANLIKNCKVI